jgi:hypothetical protein
MMLRKRTIGREKIDFGGAAECRWRGLASQNEPKNEIGTPVPARWPLF